MATRNGFQHHEHCTNCRRKTIDGRRRCGRCSSYFFIHKQERPAIDGRLPKARKYPLGAKCVVCQGGAPIGALRCRPCYHYFRRNGKERPVVAGNLPVGKYFGRKCSVCRTRAAAAADKCKRCYQREARRAAA